MNGAGMGSPGQGGKKFLRDWQELQVNYECTAHNIPFQLAGIVVYFPRVQAGGEYLFIYLFYLGFFFFFFYSWHTDPSPGGI